MRPILLAAFLTSTALAGSAAAQTQPTVTPTVIPRGEVVGRAAISECDRLAALVETARPAKEQVTPEQVRQWREANDAAACRDNLLRINQAAEAGSSGAGIQPVQQANPLPAPAAPVAQPSVAGTPPAAPAQNGAAQPNGAPAVAGAPAQPSQAQSATSPAGSSSPQVTVQQAQPTVSVRQQQPEVIVRIPPPVITVQQPQPEVIVRMPPPDVSVSMARPDVQVTIPQPQIQVVPPQATAQPNVQMEGGQPNVRVERTGEPQIVYQQSEGQPQIRFEATDGTGSAAQASAAGRPGASTSAQSTAQPSAAPNASTAQQAVAASPNAQSQPAGAMSPQGAQAQLNAGQPAAARPGEPQQTGAVPPASQPIEISRLADMAVYNARGDKLGEVDRVVTGPGNALFLVVSHGGFLGLGEKQVAMSLSQVALRGDRLVADGLTEEQIRAMPGFEMNDYKAAEDRQTAPVRVLP